MDFSLDGEFEKMSAFKVDMSDLDFSTPLKKSTEGSEVKSGKDPLQGKEGNFTFSFDFNELDDLNFDSPLGKGGQRSTKTGGDEVGLSEKTSELKDSRKSASEILVSGHDDVDSPADYPSKSEVLLETKRVRDWPEENNTVNGQPTDQQKHLTDKASVEHSHDTPKTKNQNNLVEETTPRQTCAEMKAQDQVYLLEKTATKQSHTQPKALDQKHSQLAEKRASMQTYAELKQQDQSYLPVETATKQSCAEPKAQYQINSPLAGKLASKQSSAQLKTQDHSYLSEKMKSTPKQAHANPKVQDHSPDEKSSKSSHSQLKELVHSTETSSDNRATPAAISKQMDACSLEEKSDDASSNMHIFAHKTVAGLASDCENLQFKDSSSMHILEVKNNKGDKNELSCYDAQDTGDVLQNATIVSDVGVSTDLSKEEGNAEKIDKCGSSVSRIMPYEAYSRPQHQRSSSLLIPSLVSRNDSGLDKALSTRTELPSLDKNKKLLMVAGSAAVREKEDARRALCEGKLAENHSPFASKGDYVSNETVEKIKDHDAYRDKKKVRFQGHKSTGHSLGTMRQASPFLSLKRRISEVSESPGAGHLIMPPPKHLSPGESRTLKESGKEIEEAVHGGEKLMDSCTNNVSDGLLSHTFNLPQETNGVDNETTLSMDNGKNIEKAKAFGKELEDLCNMLKKKQEEAKELVLRAIVNHNNLLLLNHFVYEQRTHAVHEIAAQLMSMELQAGLKRPKN
ncbi:hypothetical protein Dimus_021955 [Dionaea muscipula]